MNANDYSVAVRKCSISFLRPKGGSLKICQDLNLSLPCGSIYAILGPSSCGKTTLIRAILGRQAIDAGAILVFGRKVNGTGSGEFFPADVGYMPQETCVYDMLTIGETLSFYGGVLGLSRKVIRERIDFYIDFLRLPNKNSKNCNLSGGQRRRVSFAASVIHHPKLLILDEPTVGLDPIVRQSIWRYLKKLASVQSVSILLTTHFIEEARDANFVGMWHGNRLQVEVAPDLLLARLNCETLEDAFLRICSNVVIQPEGGATCETAIDISSLDLTELTPRSDEIIIANCETNIASCSQFYTFSFARIGALIWKNIIRFCRFPGALLFLLGLPPFTIFIFCTAIGRMEGLQFAARMTDSGHLGEKYLSFFESDIFNQLPVTSFEDGRDAIFSGHQNAFIDIPENFTNYFLSFYTNDARILLRSNDSYPNGQLTVTLDGINFAQNSFTLFRVVANLEKLCLVAANFTGLSHVACTTAITLHRKMDGVDLEDIPVRLFYIPGMLVISCYFVAFPCALLSFFLEKKNGYLERGYVAGITSLETMISFVAVTTVIVLLQMAGVMLVSFIVFEAPQNGSIILIFLLLLWIAVGGMSAGFMLSASTENVNTVYLFASYYLFFSIPVAGWLWPISAMPKPLLYLSYVMPFAIPIQALTGIMHHGWGFFNFKVLMAITVTTAWLPIFNAITFYKLRIKRT